MTRTALALPLLAAACATPAPAVPPVLAPDAGLAPLVTLAARGVQIYECRPAAGTTGPAWTLVAPEAELYDAQGRRVGQHGAGPFWSADDGSRVVGRVKARADAPSAQAIPWLLLDAQPQGSARGAFGGARQVLRFNTVGGVAPSSGCDATSTGSAVRIPYRADYRFYG